jgi:hypothetical protein
MHSIRLHPGSTVIAITRSSESNEIPQYEVHVTGIDDRKIHTVLCKQEVKWQLSFPSEEVQQNWLIALKNARNFVSNWPKKDEIDRLKDLARMMRNNVDARMRLNRFKLIPRCFVGRRAVRWIVKYEGCTASQAVVIGQKMLNLDLIQHITNEHVFCNKKLLYQFSSTFDYSPSSLTSPRISQKLTQNMLTSSFSRDISVEEAAKEAANIEQNMMRKLSMNTEELSQVIHSLLCSFSLRIFE